MARRALADELVETLIQELVAGVYVPGAALPSEAELAARFEMSRLTVREAIKQLASRNVVRVQHGVGTFVRPVSDWSPMDPALLSARSAIAGGTFGISGKLLEVRAIVEPGCAEIAARLRTEEDLECLKQAVTRMRRAAQEDDLEAFVAADMEFHQAVASASGNIFLAALLEPIAQLMVEARRQTSQYSTIREHAIEHHQNVLEAIEAGSSAQAADAMRAHMEQTSTDLEKYVVAPAKEETSK